MNNVQIIQNEAVASGYFTQDEVARLMSEGKDIPFHTYAVWRSLGFVPKKGEHGYETRLWKRRDRIKANDEEDAEDHGDFYYVKSYLFHISQCEKLEA